MLCGSARTGANWCKRALCEESRGSFPGFCDDGWQQPDLDKRRSKEGACSEDVSVLAVEIVTVLTAAEWVQQQVPASPVWTGEPRCPKRRCPTAQGATLEEALEI